MLDVIREMVSCNESHMQGASCNFFRLTNDFGYKMYESPAIRDYNFKLQKIASRHELGPKCYKRYEFEYFKNDEYGRRGPYMSYGYVTQLVRPINWDEWDYHITEAENPYHHVWLNLARLGIVMGDCHGGNFGMIGDRCVAIDFGEPNRHVYYYSHKRKKSPDFDDSHTHFETAKQMISHPNMM